MHVLTNQDGNAVIHSDYDTQIFNYDTVILFLLNAMNGIASFKMNFIPDVNSSYSAAKDVIGCRFEIYDGIISDVPLAVMLNYMTNEA